MNELSSGVKNRFWKFIAVVAAGVPVSSSCHKDKPPVCTEYAVDSCTYMEYPFSPVTTQIFTTGYFIEALSYDPLNPNRIAFTRTGLPSIDSQIGAYDFTTGTVLWTTSAEYNYVDWGRNGKVLFWKDVIGVIGIINGDGTGETVIETQGFAENPKWSYSGNKMIYTKTIGGEHYQIIADANGSPLDTLLLHCSNYSLSASDDNLLYSGYVGSILGFHALNLETGAHDSMAVGNTAAFLPEDLTWDADGNRFYWRQNGVVYQGNMTGKTYEAVTTANCLGFTVGTMAKHPSQEQFAFQKIYRRNQGQDTIYVTLLEYVYDLPAKHLGQFLIPLVQ